MLNESKKNRPRTSTFLVWLGVILATVNILFGLLMLLAAQNKIDAVPYLVIGALIWLFIVRRQKTKKISYKKIEWTQEDSVTFLLIPVNLHGKEFYERLGMTEHILPNVKNFKDFRTTPISKILEKNPFGFVPSPSSAYDWTDQQDGVITVYPFGYGLRISAEKISSEPFHKMIQHLQRSLKDEYVVDSRAIKLDGHHEYIIHTPDRSTDDEIYLSDDYVSKNPLGLTRDFSSVDSLWLNQQNHQALELSPEPVGLQVSIYNMEQKDVDTILAYLQAGIPMTTEATMHH